MAIINDGGGRVDNRTQYQKSIAAGMTPLQASGAFGSGALFGVPASIAAPSYVNLPTNTKGGTTGTTEGTTAPPTTGGTGGGGGGGGIKKSNDTPLVNALAKMLKTEFAKNRDTVLGNIDQRLGTAVSSLMENYAARATSLSLAQDDNAKAENDSSFANIANRMRERADILSETALQGAGESDTLKAQMMSLRNWDVNQGDIDRSFFDSERGIFSAITDLNQDTKGAYLDLETGAQGDREQTWANYYSKRIDALTQMGNIQANPYSDAYKKNSNTFDLVAQETGKAYEAPKLPSTVTDWQGSVQATEQKLNNTNFEARTTNLAQKKPEGATLRTWA